MATAQVSLRRPEGRRYVSKRVVARLPHPRESRAVESRSGHL